MRQFTATITTPNGIHGRPAVELVQAARGFQSEITITKEGRSAQATRLMALMTLCVKAGDTVTVTAQGPDEEAAISAMEQFFHTNL